MGCVRVRCITRPHTDFTLVHSDHPDWISMLTTALELRALVVILDGIDESAGHRHMINTLILDVLVPMGVRIFCTSRPEGVALDAYRAK